MWYNKWRQTIQYCRRFLLLITENKIQLEKYDASPLLEARD